MSEDLRWKRKLSIIRSGTEEQRIDQLLERIKARLPELEGLAAEFNAAEEDFVYRYYHNSYKVFNLQEDILKAFKIIREIGGEADPPHIEYAQIVKAGTENGFGKDTNANWQVETRPILEAFWHTKYFLNMMVMYAKLDDPVPSPIGSGWASVLYLYELR
jgi:hypothetical protein